MLFARKIFYSLFILTFIFSSIPFSPPQTFAVSANSCNDVSFIFARGSGEPVAGKNFKSFKSAINSVIRSELTMLKYNFYDLGSSTHGGHKYPAVSVENPNVSVGAYVSAGQAFEFNRSVEEGIAEIKSYISEVTATCPNTKFVLAGYSQGGMVISKSLPKLHPDQILYSATFGDPKLYLPEGFGVVPPACQNKYLSNYRKNVPDCRTAEGILKALKPYQIRKYRNKLGAWCNEADFMCGSYFDLSGSFSSDPSKTLLKAHLAYSKDGSFVSAAKVISQAIKKAQNPTTGPLPNSRHDTVILLDTTQSMDLLSNEFKAQVLKLATNILKKGGRVSLYEYRDLSDGFHPHQLCSLGCTLPELKSKLENVSFEYGGDDDESLLSALKTVMLDTLWEKSALKSIVVITDAGFHQPDHDGTNLKDVVDLSLKIDPVSVYPVVPTDLHPNYQELASLTGGKVFDPDSSADYFSDQIVDRPEISFDQSYYAGTIGETLEFELLISEPTNNYRFEWDLDADGIFETTTSSPVAFYTYHQPKNGFVQARVIDASGRSSLMSADLNIAATSYSAASIASASFDSMKSLLSFSASSATAATYLIINDAPIGLTRETNLKLKDLPVGQNTAITLIPIDQFGRKGSPYSINTASLWGNSPPKTTSKIKLRAPNTGVR